MEITIEPYWELNKVLIFRVIIVLVLIRGVVRLLADSFGKTASSNRHVVSAHDQYDVGGDDKSDSDASPDDAREAVDDTRQSVDDDRFSTDDSGPSDDDREEPERPDDTEEDAPSISE